MITLIILFVVAFCFVPMILSLFKMRDDRKGQGRLKCDSGVDSEKGEEGKEESKPSDENTSPEEPDEGDAVVVRVWETVRVTELKEWACFTTMTIEILLFFLWPLVSLFYYQNTNVGVVFLVLGLHMVPRHYFNASFLLQECGPIKDLDMSEVNLTIFTNLSGMGMDYGDSEKEHKIRQDLKNKAFVTNLMGRVIRSNSKKIWM